MKANLNLILVILLISCALGSRLRQRRRRLTEITLTFVSSSNLAYDTINSKWKFDITYKKSIDKDSIKLSSDSGFQQLKIMICGRYKLYDMNNIYIYYQGKNINPEEHTKLKNVFKKKKVQIEIKDTPTVENEEVSK